jgi:hypothetical protein
MKWSGFILAGVLVLLVLARKAAGMVNTNTGGGTAIDVLPSAEVRNAIVSGAQAWGIEPAFAMSVAAIESRFNPSAELNTLGRTDLREGTQPERSIGLFQVNVNPNKPAGQARLALLASRGQTAESLRDPSICVGFWAEQIVLPLMRRERNRGLSPLTKAYWLNVRVGLYASTLSVDGATAQGYKSKFSPVFDRWIASYPLV